MYIYPMASFQRPAMIRPNNLARQSFQAEKKEKYDIGEHQKRIEQRLTQKGYDNKFIKYIKGTLVGNGPALIAYVEEHKPVGSQDEINEIKKIMEEVKGTPDEDEVVMDLSDVLKIWNVEGYKD